MEYDNFFKSVSPYFTNEMKNNKFFQDFINDPTKVTLDEFSD